jgi:uncharacterized protein YndB with AHSA1/START domain
MNTAPIESRELVISRLIDAPREAIYKAWTTPELLTQWWAPKPWTTPKIDIEPRSGGRFNFTMADPDGKEYPNEGMLLEVVPNEKLVFSDAFKGGWEPSPDPFMVAIITLEDEGGKTRYTARVLHWTVDAKERHEAMGFYQGWGQCLDQLSELVTK